MSHVSIIIPAYNSARFLPSALDSVFSQTRKAGEIIVVNDGSTDDTDRVIEPYLSRIRYLKQGNCGVSSARNAGLAEAASEYVLFLDADDRLCPEAIGALLRAAECSPERGVAYGDAVYVDEIAKRQTVRRCPRISGTAPHPAQFLFRNGGFPPSTFMVPTSLARELGGFDVQFSYTADLHFFMRCGTVAPFVHVPEIVLWYRQHDGAMSCNVRQAILEGAAARISYLNWCEERGYSTIDGKPNEGELLAKVAMDMFYARDWPTLDAALDAASERKVSDARLDRIRRLRLLPACMFYLKDRCESLLGARKPA